MSAMKRLSQRLQSLTPLVSSVSFDIAGQVSQASELKNICWSVDCIQLVL